MTPARAGDDGQPLLLSESNTSEGATSLTTTNSNYGFKSANDGGWALYGSNYATSASVVAVQGSSFGPATGMYGSSYTGLGVHGYSQSSIGVKGRTGNSAENRGTKAVLGHAAFGATGVQGISGATEYAAPLNTGVYGIADGISSVGVKGEGATGVLGAATSGTGVHGLSDSGTGVRGSSIGFLGDPGDGVFGTGLNGVHGSTGEPDGSGVIGEHNGTGAGVTGTSVQGTGVHAIGEGGPAVALRVSGRAEFSRSGRAVVPAGASLVTVPINVKASDMVLATVQENTGVWVKCAVPDDAGNQFTIRLNKSPQADTTVAWFVLS